MNWNWGLRAMALDQGISVECGMDNGVLSLVTSSRPRLSVPTVSFSNSLPLYCLHTHHTCCIVTFYGIFMVMGNQHGAFFFYLPTEGQDDHRDYNVIRDPSHAFQIQHTISILA